AAGALTHTYNLVGTYTVSLMIENSGGCQSSAVHEVCVKDATRIIAPTAFSPNGDGINDVFRVRTLGVDEYDLSIFNSWGERVFHTSNPDAGWDGSYRDKPMPLDAYMYVIRYRNMELNKREMLTGNVTLIR